MYENELSCTACTEDNGCECAEPGANKSLSSVIRYEQHKLSDPSQPYLFHLGNCGIMPHWHENIEILYFHGDASVICDRKEYAVCEHDIAVFGFNALHASPINGDTKHDCLIIDTDFLARNGIDVSTLRFQCVIRDESFAALFKNVEREVKLARDGDAFGDAAVKAAILTLAVELCRAYSGREDNERVRGSVIKRAIGYIKSHYDEPLTVDRLAENVNVSKYYFCREFHSETGYTVVRYINNLRCREAERLLRDTGCSIGEVARMCGFENMSYFTRTYKSIIGKTPTETRMTNDESFTH
ncbi:MAG: helix-turn-helix transcriptional regulator [Clostridia bacterium]|nr:helix-turn-helix transcriptional regulator [Clostridia bacterium]